MRERIEAALGNWGRFVDRRAVWVIAVVLLATAGSATQLQHLRLDTSMEGFFHPDDPVRIQYDAFREAYGRDTFLLVGLRPQGGVFEAGFLETLRRIHSEIEREVPMLAEVTSLVNARDTHAEGDSLVVGDLLEDWPESEEAIAAIAERALSNPLYLDYLVTADGAITAVVIETEAYSQPEGFDALEGFDVADEDASTGGAQGSERFLSGEDDARIVQALLDVTDRHRSEELEIFVAGTPVMVTMIAQNMQRDMARFAALSIAIIAVFLGLLFRRVAAVVLPLVTVLCAVIATLSLMASVGFPVMPPTQILPSFLLAVGIGGSVHLLAIFQQARRRREERREAIAFALAHSGLPIVMTSLTTAAGLLSFAAAALRPLSHLGIIAPFGVLLALFYTLTLLPALLAIFPMREPAGVDDQPLISQRFLVRVGAFSTRRAHAVIAVWALLVAISLAGVARIHIGHDVLRWFPAEDPLYRSMMFFNDEMGGATSYEMLIDTGTENGFHDPSLLRRVEAVQRHAEALEFRGIRSHKTIALTDVVKETHRALHEDRSEFYVIPSERALVAQELLLFENAGSDDVEDFVDPQFRSGRVSIRLPMVDGAAYEPYLGVLMPEVRRLLGDGTAFEVTGMTRLLSSTVKAALRTLVRSYATAFVVITLLMILLIGRLRVGLIAMIPNIAPILLTLGLMGWAGWMLDMFTLMIGTIAIGLAVDDTIHFMHNFRRYHDETGDVETAVERTLSGTGQAILFTSLVLATSFLVYTQAYMSHLFLFGTLTATAIAMAFVADVTLAPALMAATMPSRKAGEIP